MKRYVLHILIGIALCLQACHSDLETEEMAIGMAATSVESTTRALINSADDLRSFRVDAYKEGTSNEQVFSFSKQSITRNGDKWEYNPVRYWDRKGYYYFGAYSPENIAVSPTNTKGVLTISAPNWQAIDGDETDIVVATSQGAATGYIGMDAGTVKFDFEHILAQLEVQIVRSAFLTNEYTLTGLTYKTVPTDKDNATTTYTLDYTMLANSAMAEVVTADKIAYNNGAGVVVDPEVKAETTFKHLVVPFAATTDGGLQIVVNYMVNRTPKQATVKTGVTALEAGKRYVLKLTFDSGLDIIPELEIADWEEQKIDEDPKYNW